MRASNKAMIMPTGKTTIFVTKATHKRLMELKHLWGLHSQDEVLNELIDMFNTVK
jgi:hypothetical protein